MNSTNAFRNAARRTVLALLVAVGLLHGAVAAAQVVVSEAWARATAPGAKSATAYLVFTNNGEEEARLLRIISPVSDRVMIRRNAVDSEGVSRLWPVGYLHIPPGESVRFEAGGLQVMFDELKTPFVAGQKVALQVMFEYQPEITVMVEVKPLVAEPAAEKKK